VFSVTLEGMNEIASGLWRWTAPHPDWRPDAASGSAGDWERDVGSVLYETADAAVFFDPLLPPDRDSFWDWADERVAGRPVSVLTTIRWHRRSRDDLVRRYGASTSRSRKSLPDGVEAFSLRGAGETIFWLPEPRALIPGDRILGAPGGGLRLCPDSWLPARIDRAELRELLVPLLELPVERVLVSHGEPVLRGGRAALERALAPPA
jgi:hypothetical protein